MEIPSIIFVLLFILVIVLILLHRSNKKYADKISILEQTLNMKVETITSLKTTYKEAKEAIEKYTTQKNTVALQKQSISALKETSETLEERIKNMSSELKEQQVLHLKTLSEHTDTIDIMHQESREYERNTEYLKKAYETRLADKKTEQQLLENAMDVKNNKISELSTHITRNIAHAKEVKKQLEAVIDANQGEIDNLKENNIQYASAIDAKDIEISKLGHKHESSIDALTKEIETLDRTLLVQNEKMVWLEQEHTQSIDAYMSKVTSLEEMLIHKEKQIAEVEDSHKKKQNIIQEKEHSILQLNDEIKKNAILMQTLESTKNALEDECLVKYNQIKNLGQIHIEERDSLKKEREDIEAILKHKEEEIQTLSTRQDTDDKTIVSLKKTLNEKEEIYKDSLHVQQELIKEHALQSTQLEEALTLQKEENYQLKRDLSERVLSYEKEKETVLSMVEEKKDNEERYQEYKVVVQERYRDFEERVKHKVLEIEALTQDKEKHQKHISSLEEDILLKQEMLIVSETKYQNMITLEVKEKEKLKKFKLLLEKTRNLHTEEKEKLEAYISSYVKTIAEIQEQVKKEHAVVEAKYEAYDMQLQTQKETSSTLEVLLEKKATKVDHLEKTLALKIDEMKAFTQKQKDKEENAQMDILKLNKQIKLLEEDYREKNVQHTLAIEEEKKAYSTLLLKLENKEQEIITLDKGYKEKEKDTAIKVNILNSILLEKEKDIIHMRSSTLHRETQHENKEVVSIQDEVIKAIQAGKSKQVIAKEFNIPIKRIELILKFNKIQHKG